MIENIIERNTSDNALLYDITLKLSDDPLFMQKIEFAISSLNYPLKDQSHNIYLFKTLALDYNKSRPYTPYETILERYKHFIQYNPWTLFKYNQVERQDKDVILSTIMANRDKTGKQIAELVVEKNGEEYGKIYPKVLKAIRQLKKASVKKEPAQRRRGKKR